MNVNIALINAEGTANIQSLNLEKKTLESRRVDSTSLFDESLLLALYPESEEAQLGSYLQKESKYYPIFTYETIQNNYEQTTSLDYDSLFDIYQKVANRWLLNNNLKLIEQLAPTTLYLKDLWVKDRNTFFEELWFLLKTNLNTTDLNIVFHDLKEPTDKQAEKGEKPKLCYSYVQGEKIPHLYPGKDRENVLMKEYENDFHEIFTITEYSADKGHLIACGKIELSPILIMAKLPSINQVQQALLTGLFNGLQ